MLTFIRVLAPGYTFHRSFDEIPRWNQVARVGGLYASAEIGRAFSQPDLVAVRRGEELLAVASCLVSSAPGSISRFCEPELLFGASEPLTDLYPVLYCGVARGYSSRLLVLEGLDPSLRTEVIATLFDGIRELARRSGARLIIFGFLPESDARELLALGRGAFAAYSAAESVLGPITSWDSYSKSTHAHSNREVRQFTQAGLRMERPALRDVLDLVAEVSAEHERKFDPSASADAEREDIARYVSTGLDDHVRMFCAWQGDVMLGASMVIVYGGTSYVRFASARPSAPRNACVYFNCCYYAPIRAALAEGIKYVDLGLGSLESKIMRGCRARGLWDVFEPLAPLPAGLGDQLTKAARDRFTAEAEVVRKHRGDAALRDELGFGGQLEASFSVP